MDRQRRQYGTESVTFFLVEEFTQLAFACAIEPLRIANLIADQDLYRWRTASRDGQRATASNGVVTCVDHGMDAVPPGEMLFFLSGIHVERHIDRSLLSYVRFERARGTRIGALCSGAMILAHAGLLDGEPASIHWQFHDSFRETFPDVNLRPTVFVADSRFPTAAGGSATSDLMLHMIKETHGPDLATEVADQMVYNAVRDGSGTQRVSTQAKYGIRNPHIAEAVRLMSAFTENPLGPSEIAGRLGISTRQLERLFRRYLGSTPKTYATDLRLQKARNLLLQTESSITEIALACGFGSASHFSRVYRTRYGIPPGKTRPGAGGPEGA